MNNTGCPWQCNTFKEHLEQVNYWFTRFEKSRDIDHFDNAERHAEVVKEYLPSCLQELTLTGLVNLHLILSTQSSIKCGA